MGSRRRRHHRTRRQGRGGQEAVPQLPGCQALPPIYAAAQGEHLRPINEHIYPLKEIEALTGVQRFDGERVAMSI